ncbi:hypothetical protein W97_03894 [Coniosporium apollinis CBS 100218]|uniref:CFEM domain-containing protein n=1 Tax=Coniosporium apollinis (strain CBS 100218) TaxID=1168221 RepID=R7YSP9_CONA1|nr:uncharacterized protein W97_03894 [Coniosporium apollinis CBS 100218]EON64661.1 hypothetical protein W97_03894 [Coniosporium apollinis CBS 100218]
MKFAYTTILAFGASLALAQNAAELLRNFPQCAIACLATGIGASNCGSSDFVCQCTTGAQAIQNAAQPCIQSACNADDQRRAQEASNSVCAAAGVSSVSVTSATGGAATVTGSMTTATATATMTSSAAGAAQTTNAAVSHGVSGLGVGAAVALGLLVL